MNSICRGKFALAEAVGRERRGMEYSRFLTDMSEGYSKSAPLKI